MDDAKSRLISLQEALADFSLTNTTSVQTMMAKFNVIQARMHSLRSKLNEEQLSKITLQPYGLQEGANLDLLPMVFMRSRPIPEVEAMWAYKYDPDVSSDIKLFEKRTEYLRNLSMELLAETRLDLRYQYAQNEDEDEEGESYMAVDEDARKQKTLSIENREKMAQRLLEDALAYMNGQQRPQS